MAVKGFFGRMKLVLSDLMPNNMESNDEYSRWKYSWASKKL